MFASGSNSERYTKTIMKRRILITTPIKETQTAYPNILLMRDWFLSYSDADYLKDKDFIVVDKIWRDKGFTERSIDYIDELYERLLKDLSRSLNEFHNVTHDLRMWRMIVGPWLNFIVAIVFDRWFTLEKATKEYDILGTTIGKNDLKCLVRSNLKEFISASSADEFNSCLISFMIKNYTSIKYCEVIKNENCLYVKKKQKKTLYGVFRSSILNVINLFAIKNKISIMTVQLPLVQQLKVMLALKQFPSWYEYVDISDLTVDPDKRKNFHIEHMGNAVTDFESMLYTIASELIPSVYLENYYNVVNRIDKLSWPKNPSLIFTANRHLHDDVFKIWASHKVNDGAKLFIMQHGGGRGTVLHSMFFDHEDKISDKVLSWGDANNSSQNAIRFSSAKLNNLSNTLKQKQNGDILIIMAVTSPYIHKISTNLLYSNMDKYYSDVFNFVRTLSDSVQKRIKVRNVIEDKKWEQVKRWSKEFGNIKFDDIFSPLSSSMNRSRLAIVTYNGTTILEALASNFPVIAFWDYETRPLTKIAKEDYNLLVSVGILHYSPESAALLLNEIVDDITSWWSSDYLQKTRKYFCAKYAYVSTDYIKDWKEIVNQTFAQDKLNKE